MGSFTQAVIRTIEGRSAHHYRRLPDVAFQTAKGVWIWDAEGRTYLDMFATYSALTLGANHSEIKRVMAQNFPITAHGFYTVQEVWFLESLCRVTGIGSALLANSGVEAVEAAIKLARKWVRRINRVPLDGTPEIIVAENNFHGRTTTVVGFSSEAQYRDAFGPATPGFLRVPYGDVAAIERAIGPHTAAVLLEPIQGEAGVVIPPKGYLKQVQRLCRDRKVLFMLDEVQTGFGRTGKMFCFEHEDARPDVLIVGKALGGGQYPVSAILASRELMDTFEAGDHGSTFAGNALACAIGTKTIEILERENLVARSSFLGAYLLRELKKNQPPAIKEVRGQGLFVGIELADDAYDAFDWCRALLACGVVCGVAHKHVIRLSPPLIITQKELDHFLFRFQMVVAALSGT